MSTPHRDEITLREAKGPNPPNLLIEILQNLTRELHGLIPDAAQGGRSWLKGKGDQELAKVGEIKARAIAEIGKLTNESERLINERDQAIRELEAKRDKDALEHKRDMYRLETERMKVKAEAMRDAIAAIKELRELGVEVDVSLMLAGILPK
jgi:hypothetical protein